MKDAAKSEWQVKPLGEVVTLNYGKALARSERDPNGSIPVYGANGVMDWSEHTLTEGPSLVIGRKGSAGEVTRVDGPFWPSDVTYYTTHDENALDFDFLHYTLQTLNLPSMARGVKPGINRNDVYALPIPSRRSKNNSGLLRFWTRPSRVWLALAPTPKPTSKTRGSCLSALKR